MLAQQWFTSGFQKIQNFYPIFSEFRIDDCFFPEKSSISGNTGHRSPMTDFLSLPKAQIQCNPSGTWNFVKLHLELKYFGRIPLAFAKLQVEE